MNHSNGTTVIPLFGDETFRFQLGKSLLYVLAVSALLAAGVAPASAESLKWKLGYHLTKTDVAEVGDVPGHVLVVAKGSGLGFFDTGNVAGANLSIAADYVNGAGPHDGYILYAFDDGSTFVVKIQGSTVPDPASKTSAVNGKFNFAQGTGRFSGISGGGTYAGKRLAPTAAPGAEIYMDFSGTYSR